MTSNSIRNKEAEETKRHNKVTEAETERTNRQREQNEITKTGLSAYGNILRFAADATTKAGPKVQKFIYKPTNDYKWYVESDAQAKAIASLSWGYPYGLNASTTPRTGVPGAVLLTVHPMLGISPDGSSGLNMAARSLYSYVRHVNSGSANYESPDLLHYIIALGNIYAFVGYVGRLYGTLNTYIRDNRFIPDAMLGGYAPSGAAGATLRTEVALLKTWLDNYVRRVNATFYAPKTISYFARSFFLYSRYYKDENYNKTQIYGFYPDSFLTYDEVNGTMNRVSATSGFTNINSIQTLGEALLIPLMDSETAGIMSGDIYKAFKGDIYELPETTAGQEVDIAYDPFVLEQIMNATVIPDPLMIGNDLFEQNEGNLISKPWIGIDQEDATAATVRGAMQASLGKTQYITSYQTEPDAISVLESTRFMVITEPVGNAISLGGVQYYAQDIVTCGTEIITNVEVVMDAVYPYTHTTVTSDFSNVNTKTAAYLMGQCFANFRYFPACVVADTSGVWRVVRPINQWTVINADTLRFMNDSIMLHMFRFR